MNHEKVSHTPAAWPNDGRRRYYNEFSLQIISAGADGIFGLGGLKAGRAAGRISFFFILLAAAVSIAYPRKHSAVSSEYLYAKPAEHICSMSAVEKGNTLNKELEP
jgi:hypothetical protein